jgi:hypothetical protein
MPPVNKRFLTRWALAGLAGGLLLVACDDPSVDLELATSSTERQAFYTDTLTVRTSTVLVDSVPSSATSYLLTGRYIDAQLGTIEASSYLQPSLAAEFLPTTDLAYDSLVIELTPDAYRYGDTTHLQTMQVHRVQQAFQTNKTYYTKDALTYDATPLGQHAYRAVSSLSSLRVRLGGTLGQDLWQAGLNSRLTTTDELRDQLKGLVLRPGAADNGAIVRWAYTGTLHIYYHDLLDPSTALNTDFVLGGADNGHFFQLQADRANTLLASLTRPTQALSSTATSNQTFIEAGLGLCTKIEFPYLLDFRNVGTSFVFSSSELKLDVIRNTASRSLPVPALLLPQLTTRGNRLGALFLSSSGTTVTAPAITGVSTHTGLDQTTYTLDCSAYIEGVVLGTIANDGLLLSAETATASVGRVVLGGAAHPDNPLRLSAYYTRLGK